MMSENIMQEKQTFADVLRYIPSTMQRDEAISRANEIRRNILVLKEMIAYYGEEASLNDALNGMNVILDRLQNMYYCKATLQRKAKIEAINTEETL